MGERCALNPDRYRAAHPSTPFSLPRHLPSLSFSLSLSLSLYIYIYIYIYIFLPPSFFCSHTYTSSNLHVYNSIESVRRCCCWQQQPLLMLSLTVCMSRTCLNASRIAQLGSVYYFRACAILRPPPDSCVRVTTGRMEVEVEWRWWMLVVGPGRWQG